MFFIVTIQCNCLGIAFTFEKHFNIVKCLGNTLL